jgi:hypothetical protein
MCNKHTVIVIEFDSHGYVCILHFVSEGGKGASAAGWCGACRSDSVGVRSQLNGFPSCYRIVSGPLQELLTLGKMNQVDDES